MAKLSGCWISKLSHSYAFSLQEMRIKLFTIISKSMTRRVNMKSVILSDMFLEPMHMFTFYLVYFPILSLCFVPYIKKSVGSEVQYFSTYQMTIC